ncbi:DUF4296 domain-containing protein [Psychroserpens burtonensis]|uniref:DUF4296 domain-containing protein n=1 Tax=Psychroserpens burtonensis TaxID=49278 RepID=A0A5C7BA92_9FLAO|nr:DUF4296 domain-containing protein [Psychroserpens burtonensis]TXE19404.1 DUF4296 domain-containing protein [Psychroserpens burtonensis]
MRQVFIFLMTILVFSCNSAKKPKKPDDLISKDKMVDILYEVLIINAAKGTSKTILENQGVHPEDYIFKKYRIDSLQFVSSNEYYGFDVEEYESIIIRVEDRIIKTKDEFQTKIDKDTEEKQRKKDSIKQLVDTLKVKKIRKLDETKKLDYKNYPDSSK